MLMGFISRFIALIIIVIFSPLFVFIFLMLLSFQGRPVFFQQKRIGYKFKEFNIIKFRTMIPNDGSAITKKNDSRITFLGKILRKSKLDEIPQLFNIVNGEMRFIGPRPEIIKYFDYDKFEFLNHIKPGLSDYSSIILRNEDQILDNIGGDSAYEQLLPIKIKLANYYAKKKIFLFRPSISFCNDFRNIFTKLFLKIFYDTLPNKNVKGIKPFIEEYLY